MNSIDLKQIFKVAHADAEKLASDVTETSLGFTATQVVTAWTDGRNSLTDGVVKAAQENSYNADQTMRLVERVNTEAFLTVFPKKNEFDVAEPKIALAKLGLELKETPVQEMTAKLASDTEMCKAASAAHTQRERFRIMDTHAMKQAMRSFDDIFGNDASSKVASSEFDALREEAELKRCKIKFAHEKRELAELQMKIAAITKDCLDEADRALYNTFKQAALVHGIKALPKLEANLISAYPEMEAITIGKVSNLNRRVAREMNMPLDMIPRAKTADVNFEEFVDHYPEVKAYTEFLNAARDFSRLHGGQ